MNIADLPNFGPKSQQMLALAGIVTIEQLRELGAVRAYVKVKRVGNVSLNLLWAMEGALSGQHWQQVAKHERLRLLLELEDVETGISQEMQASQVTLGRLDFGSGAVAKVFDSYPPRIRIKLLTLRELIYQIAAETEGVGALAETLKWGEPAYLTINKSGSTIRLGWKKSAPAQYALYFHCQTNLIETFRTLFHREFKFEGNRAIVFNEADEVPMDSLAFCIAAALTYHRDKSAARKGCK
ncbi:MAG: TfoX/Sxy family DNA transformation protein [Sideroxydans sp.]|nr:TfoX/Sxy family DNA transformation protein [Sideroxydans sp.]